MTEGTVELACSGVVATVTFNRPAARNAMTWGMYRELGEHCRELAATSQVRAVVFRGAGCEAFVAGTDISQFSAFGDGDDGLAYERQIDQCIALIEKLPMPTVAAIEGWAVGGGLAIATACDFRVATPGARFGVPIASTVGNTLSMANFARLSSAWGLQRVRRMLLLAEMLRADEGLACGFLHQVCESGEIENAVQTLTERLAALAPVTQSVVKEALRRLTVEGLPVDDDLIRRVYGSADFKEGVAAFMARTAPAWTGR